MPPLNDSWTGTLLHSSVPLRGVLGPNANRSIFLWIRKASILACFSESYVPTESVCPQLDTNILLVHVVPVRAPPQRPRLRAYGQDARTPL